MATLSKSDFIRILRKFADSPDDVLEERNLITCNINGEDLSLSLFEKDEILMCKEDDKKPVRARRWIETRLARLDVLAQKIKEVVKFDQHFVPVKSDFQSTEDSDVNVDDTVKSILERLDAPSVYSTEVIYLLSEAGDGKSMIMNRLAYCSAENYLAGQQNPIFLPISLDGRPFLRIDDLVVGILANRFRFRYCYFDAIIELVKMGSLVLGLDGFEEMVVEGKEERVISSLGELLKELMSSGRMVISARRAFYDYALRNQMPLLESLKDIYVDFNAYRLTQWRKDEVVVLLRSFTNLRGKEDGIYDALVDRFGEEHPIITRPVLTRHLVDVIAGEVSEGKDWTNAIKGITSEKDPQQVMADFVDLLVEREANYKWLVTSGPARGFPVLSIEEHNAILSALAEDMWLSSVEFVRQDYLQDWVELSCMELGKTPAETTDCREKILHHAILLRDNEKYYFCHEAFRKHFLGISIAKKIIKQEDSYLLERILSQEIFDAPIVDKIVFELKKSNAQYSNVTEFLQAVKGGASRLTAIGQNVGSIAISYTKLMVPDKVVILKDLFFTATATSASKLSKLKFVDCTFEKLDIATTLVEDVEIEHCTIMVARVDKLRKAKNFIISENSLPSAIEFVGIEELVYNPELIRRCMVHIGGLHIDPEGVDDEIAPIEMDEKLKTLVQLTKLFQRTSGLSDRALEVRFGKRWSKVQSEILPQFERDGILAKREWYGGGGDYRYKLAIKISCFEAAKNLAYGSYDRFISLLRTSE